MEDFDQIFAAFKSGDSVFIPGSSAEPRGLVEAISARSNSLLPLHITNTFIPGINTIDLATAENSLSERAFFPRGGKLFDSERIQFTRSSWMQAYQFLEQQSFDWLVVQVSTPDKNGDCSLGTSIEFLPMLLQKTHKVIAVINQLMPAPPGAPLVNVSEFDIKVDVSHPLVSYQTNAPDEVTKKIAANLITLVDDASILQIGIGNVPDQFVRGLQDRKNLKFHSGMLSDSFLALHDAGALDKDFPHICTLTLGSADFYQRLPEVSNLSLVGVETSHAAVDAPQGCVFTAINTALQFDLDGRANLEFLGSRRVSNVGGALDFAKRTSADKNAKNIIAMPATASSGKISRVVASLDSAQHSSLGDSGVDYIVTEFGIADIGSLTGYARAEAIVDVAAPKFQAKLVEEYAKIL